MASVGMTAAERRLTRAVGEAVEQFGESEREAAWVRELRDALEAFEDDLGHQFAVIRWRGEDIASLRPGWSPEACEQFLSEEESRLEDYTIEKGWDFINDNLRSRGGDPEGPAPEDLETRESDLVFGPGAPASNRIEDASDEEVTK